MRHSALSAYDKLTEHEREVYSLKRQLASKSNLSLSNQHQALLFEKKCIIKDNQIEKLEAELEEMKELLFENDIEFGDMINSSDRGYEMRYD
jgi:cell shape-determining protein MreC